MNFQKDLRLAVLIDADNVPYSHIKEMLEEVTKYGTPTFKRIYGDFTSTKLSGWKNVLLEHAITPVQQYAYTSGKNATDAALIIDAMDILYSGKVDGFCIVSSDSDFTKLATRLREAGMKVIGIGEKKTPTPFISSCEKFIYIEILKAKSVEVDGKSEVSVKKQQAATISKIDKRLVKVISDSVEDIADDEGWAFLGELGNTILRKQPDFDPRNYGFAKMLPLIKSIRELVVDERETGKGNIRHVFVKVK